MNTIELIEIAIGCTATVLAGVWFIIHKVYGMGKLIQKVSDLPCRKSKLFSPKDKKSFFI